LTVIRLLRLGSLRFIALHPYYGTGLYDTIRLASPRLASTDANHKAQHAQHQIIPCATPQDTTLIMQNPTNGRPSNKIYINEHGYHALLKCSACIIGRCDCIFLLRSEIRNANTGLKVLWKCAKCTRDARSCLVGGVDVSLDKRREYGDASRRYEGTARGAGVTRGTCFHLPDGTP
jgi:hypothetical protein